MEAIDSTKEILPNVMVIGQSGKGKSTFLNFISEGKSGPTSKFKAKAGGRSTTQEVQPEIIKV